MIRAIVISLTATAVFGMEATSETVGGGDAAQEPEVKPKFEVGAFVHKTGNFSAWSGRNTWVVLSNEKGKCKIKKINKNKTSTVAENGLKRVLKTYTKGTPVLFQEEGQDRSLGIVISKLKNKFEGPDKAVELNVGSEKKNIKLSQILMAYFPLNSDVVKKGDERKFQIAQSADEKNQYVIRLPGQQRNEMEMCQDTELSLIEEDGKPNFQQLQSKFKDWDNKLKRLVQGLQADGQALTAWSEMRSEDLREVQARRNDFPDFEASNSSGWFPEMRNAVRQARPFDDIIFGERPRSQSGADLDQKQKQTKPIGEGATNFVKEYKIPLALSATALAVSAAACLIPTDEDQEDKKADGNGSGYSTATKAAGVLGTVGAVGALATGLYKFYKSRKSEPQDSSEATDSNQTSQTSRTVSSKKDTSSDSGLPVWVIVLIAVLAILVIVSINFFLFAGKASEQDQLRDLEEGLGNRDDAPDADVEPVEEQP